MEIYYIHIRNSLFEDPNYEALILRITRSSFATNSL